MLISKTLAVLVVVGPVAIAAHWYNGRLRQLKEAALSIDKSAESIIAHDDLRKRVIKEGWVVMGGVLVYWVLLSILL
ncbi:MAG TPA: hypothetical protein VN803_00630 [Gemmatimonadales bacterium]|nr:hypothetical protein [Gemmatimonadales bacterium]